MGLRSIVIKAVRWETIIDKNPKTAKPFKINCGWDGSSKFILTADPTKKD